MNQRFKKIFSVLIAILVGAGIIFFAWQSGLVTSNKLSSVPGSDDSSWKDALSVVPQASSTYTKGLPQSRVSVEATTTTDFIARELLVNYALMQQKMATTTLSDADAQALAQMTIEKIKLPQGVVYTEKNLVISNDNSDASFTAYSKKVSDVVHAFASAHKMNELSLVADALTAKDGTKLQGLAVISAQYRGLQKSLLAVSTPSKVAPLHLRLVQGYANIGVMVATMQEIVSDPVLGLAALTQYKKEFDALDVLAVEYRDYTPTH